MTTRNSAVFPVYLSARCFAALLRAARDAGVSTPEGTKPSASGFLRACLGCLAGPESGWPPTDEAVAEIAAAGFSVVQFRSKRFLRGQAAEDRVASQQVEGDEGSRDKITPLAPPRASSRREELLSRLLAGEELSASEQKELET